MKSAAHPAPHFPGAGEKSALARVNRPQSEAEEEAPFGTPSSVSGPLRGQMGRANRQASWTRIGVTLPRSSAKVGKVECPFIPSRRKKTGFDPKKTYLDILVFSGPEEIRHDEDVRARQVANFTLEHVEQLLLYLAGEA